MRKEPLESMPFRVDSRADQIEANSTEPVSGVVRYAPPENWEQIREEWNPLDLLVGANARCNQDAFGSWQNEISISGSPISTSYALAGSNDYRGSDSRAGFYRTIDGGATWTDVLQGIGNATLDAAGDPVCTIDRTGRMYAAYIAFDRSPGVDNGLYVQRSLDNGLTWTTPTAVIQHIGGGNPDFEDKPYACADITPGSPYLGRYYITWTKFRASGGNPIYFSRSTDGGATFSTGVQISSGTNCQFSCPTVGPNGEIYVTWQEGGNTVKFRKSLDGGTTWQPIVTVATYSSSFPTNPCGTFRHIMYPVIGSDISGGAYNGNIYIAYGASVSSSPEIYFTRSTDGGSSWSVPYRLNDVATGWQYHHWMAVNPTNGLIGAAWLDTREDGSSCQYKNYGSISNNGGASFPAAAPVATVASNPTSSVFLGDYNGVSYHGDHFFAGWTDLRNDAGDCYAATFAPDPVAPANDACPGTFVSIPYTGTGSTQFANHETANCLGNVSPDVFYYFFADSCGSDITVSLCGSGYDTALEILGGCGGTSLFCNDDFCSLQSSITFTPTANTYYTVRVFGFTTHSGDYTINITQAGTPPANDNCSGATAITALPYSDTGSTCFAANDYDYCFMNQSPEVVYTLTLTDCEDVTVSLCGSFYDTRLTVRTGGACPGTDEIACNDDFCGLQSQVTFSATQGVVYYIIVGGFSTHRGAYTLNITGTSLAPANDVCSGAYVINSLPYTDTGSTLCANADYSYFGCYSDDFMSRDVVYRLNVPTCQTVQVSTCDPGTNYDTRIQVMAGGACPGNTLVACNDDFCGLQSELSFGALANTDYYILIRGYRDYSYGDYIMTVTSLGSYTSANDVCPGTSITAIPYTTFGNTSCSNDDYANGDCYFSESSPEDVFNLTLGTTQYVTVSLCGSGYDTGLKVRRGGACPGDVMVVCDDDAACGGSNSLLSTVEFTANAGVTYFIQVSGFTSNSGPYTFHVEPSIGDPVDSLVIKSVGNTVQLWWDGSPSAYYYYIHRSASQNDLFSWTTLVDATLSPTTTWTDPATLSDQLYYGVTAVPDYMIPALLAAGLGERPIQEVLRDANAQLKITAEPVEAVEYYSGPISDSPELAEPDKIATKFVPTHIFGAGVSIEHPVEGKDYSAQ